jgi:hypothetical protein
MATLKQENKINLTAYAMMTTLMRDEYATGNKETTPQREAEKHEDLWVPRVSHNRPPRSPPNGSKAYPKVIIPVKLVLPPF